MTYSSVSQSVLTVHDVAEHPAVRLPRQLGVLPSRFAAVPQQHVQRSGVPSTGAAKHCKC
eukprot:13345853-Alexandrium_andersonii.AAC.1